MIGTLTDRFLYSAGKYPDRPALLLPGKVYSYLELQSAAEAVAAEINSRNDECRFVEVVADKSFACFSRILGILMAGKAYLPLNPRFPEERNVFMMKKAGLGTPSLPDRLSKPAYLLFTSGTTGEPKGVAVAHKNVLAYLDFMLKSYPFSPEDRFTQNFDLTFDLSVHDLFLCWSAGACLCVPEDNSSFGMVRFLKEVQPTVWFSVPSVISMMDRMRLLKQDAFPFIRMSFFCGEALPVHSVTAWKKAAPFSGIVNLYGPTEATIAISRYEIPPDISHMKQELGIVSVGKVFEGNDYQLIDENMAMKPEQGELCLSGAQVIEGYLENPEADRQSFFKDEHGKTWYKTGDMVKTDPWGDLFFLGRLDSEVKISGYRVNLREIENVLSAYDPVAQAVVIYDQEEDARERLIAFILAEHNTEIIENELNGHCRRLLPWYMVPVKYIFVEEIPLNQNGKVDRAVLLKNYGGRT